MSSQNRQIFLKRFNSISEDGKSQINSPTNKNFTSQFNDITQTKKKIERLQKQAKTQREKRQEIETKYESFKERFVNRQRQFYRILQKYNTTRQKDTKDDVYISQIYQKILCTFDAFNQKARQLLDDRYSELYRLMERRIDILMQKMDKQLSKYRKISQAERKEIQQAMKEMGSIAAQTQNENILFRKKNSQLHLKVEMLNEEKKLLLQEIVGLKAYISKLNQKEKLSVKNKEMKNKDSEIWYNTQSIKMETIKSNHYNNGRVLTARGNNRYGQKSYMDNVKGNTISIMKTIDNIKTDRGVLSNQQKIIIHLKQCLQRQKNKNLQLIKFSLQLQAKIQGIKSLVSEQINREKTRSSQKSIIRSANIVQDKDNQMKFQSKTQNVIQIQLLNQEKGKKLAMTQSQQNEQIQKHQISGKKQLSILINEINKILHLPQTKKYNQKSQQNYGNEMLMMSQQNHQQKSRHSIDKKVDKNDNIKNQSIKNNNSNNHRRKLSLKREIQTPQSKLSNRSIIFNEQPSHKNVKNPLFINYSPLDIDDITRSIEIK